MTARPAPTRAISPVGLLLALLFVSGLGLAGCGQTPQITGDEDCLVATDALWTAVSAKSVVLLDQSAAAIDKLHAEAKMSDEAYATLNEVVKTGRLGDWSNARKALKTFIQGQRPAAKKT